MKARRNGWPIIVTVLLACGAAFAQLPQSLPIGMGGMPFRRAMRPSRPGATSAPDAQAEGQPEAPALTLTWGIYTYPGSVGSYTVGATKSGEIVGEYGNLDDDGFPDYGFLLKGTKFTTFSYPGSLYTLPLGINDSGVIVGAWGTSVYSSDEHGFILKGKTYTSVDYPGATQGTVLEGINKSGDIVGAWSNSDTTEYGFLLSKGVFTSVNYPGVSYTVPLGINNAGEIVGTYLDSASNFHGFLCQSGTYTTLDYPGYSNNYVADINDSGLIVGGYGNDVIINGVPYYEEHAYVYQSGTFTTFDAPFGPPAATGISHLNNDDVITGWYADNTSTTYGYTAVVGP